MSAVVILFNVRLEVLDIIASQRGKKGAFKLKMKIYTVFTCA
jgi:translation elongation factor P/translation initiation factor 5A